MSTNSQPVKFLAVLIYSEQPERFTEEPHIFEASHPEIAYQCAIKVGAERCFNRQFFGLSELYQFEGDDESMLACRRGGNATDNVVAKQELSAFVDEWKYGPVDQEELLQALREPDVLFEIPGITDIPWHELSHAYGSASDVPTHLRHLAATDPKIREAALWNLGGNIYHQGDIFNATAAALPLLLRVVAETHIPNRLEVLELITAIADSVSIVCKPDQIRATWRKQEQRDGAMFKRIFRRSADEIVDEKLEFARLCFEPFKDNAPLISNLLSDSNPGIQACARKLHLTLHLNEV